MQFDIEKARAGEPVERIYGARWQQVEFVAQWNDQEAICRIPEHDFPQLIPLECLRMATKKVKVRWRIALIGSGLTLIANDEGHERVLERGEWGEFKQWLTEWQEAEVEQ
jgi:hypothetical protein